MAIGMRTMRKTMKFLKHTRQLLGVRKAARTRVLALSSCATQTNTNVVSSMLTTGYPGKSTSIPFESAASHI